jgi:2-keto-4-pentenoate hydratase
MDTKLIETVASRLRDAQQNGTPIPPIREELASGGVEAAYAVQNANTQHAIKQGRRLVGRKVGLTSKSVQKQLGVDSPDFGMLFADMGYNDSEEVSLSKVLQAKVEAEVAFVLEKDVTHEQVTLPDLISAVAYALPAIEIVGSRIANWDIKLLDTVADNASSGLFVLGAEPRKLDGLDLRLCGMVMELRGEAASVGAGAACLGHPLNAALWLARTMVKVGRPLKAGDVVMSGALGPMVAVKAGDVIDTRINGLGSVRAAFAN